MKKAISIFLIVMLMVSAIPASYSAGQLDKEIQEMVEKGVMQGYGNGDLGEYKKVTRGQFAAFLTRALQLTGGKPRFKDVPATLKLAASINAAAEAGIISGSSNGNFYPENFITREQMAIMIHKTLLFLNMPGGQAAVQFTDLSGLSSFSRLAISGMTYHNIISGIPNVDQNGKDLGTRRFEPRTDATRGQAAAFIYRLLKAVEQDQQEPVQAYQVGTVDNSGKLAAGAKNFKTYEEAEAAMNSDKAQVMMINGQIIKMNAGIVVAKPTATEAATKIYKEDLKNHYFNVDAGKHDTPPTELEYVESDEEKIKVKVAGVTGYVKHTDAYLLPEPMVTGRAYYAVDSAGNLLHYLYDFNKKSYSSPYTIGAAPDFMKTGVRYYSWDGETFRTENGSAGTAYQYFNLLSGRTKTNYTAAEINAYIDQELARREALGLAAYKDATKQSKLKNIGSSLKQIEEEYKVNALMLLGIAINESTFGMSRIALTKNNLFGLSVYDNAGIEAGDVFNSPHDSLVGIAKDFLNKNYIPIPLNGNLAYQNGAQLGNKKNGINRRYASDPNWGKKAAGHMYTFDKAMGGKDFLQNPNPHVIGVTTQWVNVRTSADSKSALLFTYPAEGFSVAIVDTVKGADGADWYKVLSDTKEQEFAYIHSDYIKKIQVVK